MTNELDQFKSALAQSITSFGIEGLTDAQINQLAGHYLMLRQWNRRVNLTRIIEPREAARLHYGESLFGGRLTSGARTILDIGSGAGFPAIPLAVLRVDAEVTALEANNKKSLFLNEAKDALALRNFKVATARLEAFDWSAYELLTSRALDRAEEVLPPVIARLGERQRFMLYCAPDLLANMDPEIKEHCRIETHLIPQTKARIIAIFQRA